MHYNTIKSTLLAIVFFFSAYTATAQFDLKPQFVDSLKIEYNLSSDTLISKKYLKQLSIAIQIFVDEDNRKQGIINNQKLVIENNNKTINSLNNKLLLKDKVIYNQNSRIDYWKNNYEKLKESESKWYNNEWLYFGAGVITTGIILIIAK
jgi:hypothetical protein